VTALRARHWTVTISAAAVEPISLGTWPTPLEPAHRLAVSLGLDADDLWVKRDDLCGLGGGGNKVRKLQYTCADALAKRATALVTSGAAQSNHARLTAAAAARLGLRCVLVLEGQAPPVALGNLVLDHLADATVIWAGDVGPEELADRVQVVARQSREQGLVPYVIPFGGSSPLAAHGYVDAAVELETQLPDLDHVVVAVGSGGTMAGLVAHLGASRVVGIDTGAVPDAATTVRALVARITAKVPEPNDLQIHRDQIGDGYATLTPAAQQAMHLAARTEGLFLDPTYTARGLAGLRQLVADGHISAGQRTVFVHTGGLPGLFGHPQLPTLMA
jgi:L-cysteate sulfo-lyase